MKNKKSTSGKSKLRRMIENKGFYIALFSLAAIMGFSIYAGRLRLEKKNSNVAFDDAAWQEALSESGVEFKGNAASADSGEASETGSVQSSSASAPHSNKADTEAGSEKSKQTQPSANGAASENSKHASVRADTKSEQTVQTAAEAAPHGSENLSMQLPCSGKIISGCSLDDLVYCSTMDDWRTHNGMDIAAAEGDPVKAAADGTVSQVYEDELLGVVVVIDHGNKISTLYGNLQSSDFIRTGTAVRTGDIIGGIGKPGALESDKGTHLHFEVQKDGEYCNPSRFIGA